MKTLKELSHDTFYNMGGYHQITIDFVQNTEEEFIADTPETREEQQYMLGCLGALSYNLDITIDICNPALKNDMDVLKNLQSLIEIRMAYVETLELQNK